MDVVEVAAVVAIPAVSALAAAWKVSADLQVKRHVEMARQFMDLVAIAHARAGDREVGISEQVAAVELIAAFGRGHKLFREPAFAMLTSIEQWSAGNRTLHDAVVAARGRLVR